MPAGVSWGQYMKFSTCAMVAMLAGAQVVHMYYRPLDDLDAYVANELEKKKTSKGKDAEEKRTN